MNYFVACLAQDDKVEFVLWLVSLRMTRLNYFVACPTCGLRFFIWLLKTEAFTH